MPVAHRVSVPCPRCGDDSDIWLYEQPEGNITKELFTCEMCGAEWSAVKQG